MAKSKKKQKNLIKKLASERIELLFELAGEEYLIDPGRSNRYVRLARRIGMRYRVRLPSHLKRRMCKQCLSFLVPGGNSRVRLKDGNVIITCLNCGACKRYPYAPGKSGRKNTNMTNA